MFNKLKSFSEDVAKSLNEIQQGDSVRRNADNIRQLKNGQAILSTNTPDSAELVQPEDEPATATTGKDKEVQQIQIATSGPLKDIDLNQLPVLVRAKLKKFAKYEEKYPVLLDAFKTEKRKGELVIAFEKVLKECTPVSTISDAGLLVDYLNSLNEKASLLDAELRKTMSELTKANKQNSDLAKKLANAEKTIKYAEEAADKEQVHKKSLQDEKAQLTEYMKKLETQLNDSLAEIEKLKADAEKFAEQAQTSKDEQKVEEQDPKDKQVESKTDSSIESGEIESLKKCIEEKNETIQSLLLEKSHLESKIQALNEEYDKAKHEMKKMEFEKDDLIQKHQIAQKELSLKLNDSHEEKAALDRQIEASKRELDQTNVQLEKLTKASEKLVNPDSFIAEREDLKTQFSEVVKAKEGIQQELADANMKISSLTKEISSIQELTKEQDGRFKKTVEEKESAISELQLTIDSLKQQVVDFEVTQNSFTDKIESLEQSNALSVAKSESDEKRIKETKLQISALESKISELKDELSLKSAEVASSPVSSEPAQQAKGKGKKKKGGKGKSPEPSPAESGDWEDKLEALNQQIEKLELEKIQLISEKKEAIEERGLAIQEKEKYVSEKGKIFEEKEALLAENASLLASIKAAESKCASQANTLSEGNADIDEKLKNLTKEREDILKRNEDLANAKDSLENEKKKLMDEKEMLEEEKKKLVDDLKSLEKEKTELIQTKESLEKEKIDLLEEKLKLKAQAEEGVSVQSRLENERNDLENSISKLEANLEATTGNLERLQAEKENIEAEKAKLEQDVTNHNRTIASKNEEIENLRDLLKVIGDDLVTAKDQIKEIKQTSKYEFEEKLKELKNLNDELQKLIENKEGECLRAESKVKELEDQLTKAKELSEKAKKDLKDAHTKLSAVSTELESAKKEILSLTSEKQKLNKRVDELSKFKSADSSLKLEIASMQSSISHKDEQIRELKEMVEKKNKERDELNNTISTLKATNSDLVNSNKSLVSEKSTLINKHEMAVERTNSLNGELTKLQISRQKVVTELDALKLQHEALLNSKSKTSDDVQAFKQQCEELTMKVKDAQVKIDNLEDDLFEAGNMLQERTRESTTIRKLLIEAEEQSNIKTAELKNEIRSLNEEKHEIESQLHAALKKKQRESDEFKDIAERHASTIKELESTIEALNRKYEPLLKVTTISPEAQQKQKDLEGIIAELRVSLSDSSKKIKDYENLNSILKKLNEETSLKFERLSKNYKQITQQYRQMQEQKSKQVPSTLASEEKPRAVPSAVSIPYLKNVLVGFLEHREQREQLLPVMKTLFEFNEDDERKLISALK